MTKLERAKRLTELREPIKNAKWRSNIGTRRDLLSMIIPLLDFNEKFHKDATEASNILGTPGMTHANYEQMESRLDFIIGQAIIELEHSSVLDGDKSTTMRITNSEVISLGKHVASSITEHERYLCYLGYVSRSCENKDKTLKWTVAAASCGPFIAKWQAVSAEGASWFLALVPLLAIGLPIIKISESIGDARELHGKISGSVAILKDCFRLLLLNGDRTTIEDLSSIKSRILATEEALDKIRGDKLKIPNVPRFMEAATKEVIPLKFPPVESHYITPDTHNITVGVVNFLPSSASDKNP